jgi:uncharacterized BrkB/YihY/UPF0761 family membrane protein
MTFRASKWKLCKKSPLLFVITVLANSFIFPGLYFRLPRGEKVRKMVLIGSFYADKTKRILLGTTVAKHLIENVACAMSSGATM